MIAGTIVIEDSIIQFRQLVEEGEIEFQACDALTGKQYGMRVPQERFTKAITIALSNDPDTYPEDWWASAELCQGEEVRWIP